MFNTAVASAALNQTPLDWENNTANILAAITQARRLKVQLLCLPELCVTGYGCEDAFLSPAVSEYALNLVLDTLAPQTRGMIVNFGLPLRIKNTLYNATALAVDGSVRGFVLKQNLAGYGVHYEPRWFSEWMAGAVTDLSLPNGQSVPVGDLVFNLGKARLGFEICEDAWVINRPAKELAKRGVNIILNPSASHFSLAKAKLREGVVLKGSRIIGGAYLYSNLLGCEAGRIIYDGDTIVAQDGAFVAKGDRFSFKNLTLTKSTLALTDRVKDRARDLSLALVDCQDFKFKSPKKHKIITPKSAHLKDRFAKANEEFTSAVTLALFDYLRKSRADGFVVSLSGGVDSSAVSCLVVLMVEAAIKELGLAGFKEKLQHIGWMNSSISKAKITKEILLCAYQRLSFSSEVTHSAAKALALQLGATFLDLDLKALHIGYKELVERALGESISWKEHDTALQNIQARVRSPSIWFIANLRKALLLTTSNMSEAAVGYTTMDGDSSGGLAPLGGISKSFLREWLVWLERKGPLGLRRFSALKVVNGYPPTAELRPASEKQTDEGDLMPYTVLDAIERLAVRDKLSPVDVWRELSKSFAKRYPARSLASWVERFFKLWSANQWKRERYAPSFHLDDHSVDPKSWCRFPILSGGFKVELSELRRVALSKRRKGRVSKRGK